MALRGLLERLDLLSNKAVFFLNEENSDAPVFSSETQKKLNIIKPDAYYSFNNQPYILFFDLENEKNKQREDDIHKKVWSFDYSPLIFIIKTDEIKIFNAFSYNKKTERLKEVEFEEGESIDNLFSFWNLQSGETWKWIQEKKYKDSISKKRVNQKLFDNIKEVREKLHKDGLPEEDANTFILRLIFIRYLIDRQVKIDTKYISGNNVLQRRRSFSKLITNTEKLNLFFDYLNERFNGVLFKNTSINLSAIQASSLALVFDEKAEINTPTLFDNLDDFYFEIFDFSIIPVEVISGIYESLIDKEKKQETSAVYTPSFLVEYILKETVDQYLVENNTSECKIFDPACGSGIFLVQALRRMIDKELELNQGTLNKKEFISTRIGEIAKNNLFGIDINEQALKVACFSIYVALLDYQEPKDIDKYTFPNLIGENLFEANFFKNKDESGVAYKEIIDSKNINYILGNPPWKNGRSDEPHYQYLLKNKLTKIVSDFQLAQSFLIRTKDFSKEQINCALIVTSKSFYNANATNFKNYFLDNFYLNICFDLSAVRRLIFEQADNPAMILFYKYSNNELTLKNLVKHISIKSNIFLKYFKTLIIEKADKKNIIQNNFRQKPWMFKVALYGGSIDFNFLTRLPETTIQDFLENNSLISGNGIKRGTPKQFYSFLEKLPLIETKQIKPYYTFINSDLPKINKEQTYLEAGRVIELFKGVRILLGKRTKSESYLNVSYVEEDCVYKDSVNSICFPNSKIETAKCLYAVLISELYTYFQFLTSSSWGTYYPEIHKKEFLSFPVNEARLLQDEEYVNLINKFLQPLKEYYNQKLLMGNPPVSQNVLAEINSSINTLYEVSEIEEDLIDYVLEVSRYQFQESKQHKVLNYRDKENDLKKYAEVFLKEFNNIYDNEYLNVEIYPLNYFTAINFKFTKDKLAPNDQIKMVYNKTSERDVLSIISEKLSIWNITNSKNPENNIYIQKDVKGFEKDSFYIIKPNEYKCWHRAMAWYDVAEIKEVIEEAELKLLNSTKDVS